MPDLGRGLCGAGSLGRGFTVVSIHTGSHWGPGFIAVSVPFMHVLI